MRKVLTIVAGAVFVLLIVAAAFYGGTVFERSRVADVRSAFMAERGAPGAFGVPGPLSGPDSFGSPRSQAGEQDGMPGMAGFGRGATGRVKSIEGNTLLVSTAQEVTTVILTDQTTIIRIVHGDREDLQADQQVTVIGERSESGEIAAMVIQILVEEP